MSETLTEDDLSLLRSAAARGRETLRGVPFDFVSVSTPVGVAAAAIAVGAGELLPVVHHCRCGAVVTDRLDVCGPCRAEDQAYLRGRRLANAFESVSPDHAQDWCRVGTPDYAIATRGAVAACESFAEPGRSRALRIVAGNYKRADGSLLLLGPTRIGKTCIATACALRVLDLGVAGKLDASAMAFAAGIRFVSGLELAREREETKLGAKGPLAVESEGASLLILDEIGFEKKSTDPTAIRDLIWSRARRGRPTIVTSGRTRAQLENAQTGYGEPLIRRIEEVGMVIDMHRGAK